MWSKGTSARRLASFMNIGVNQRDAELYIRWKRVDDVRPGRPCINKRDAVRLASNKFKSLIIISENNIKTVSVSTDIRAFVPKKDCIFFGRDFYHTRGQDIEIYKWPFRVSRRDYYTLYIKPDNEYRYHVAFGKVILATKKVLAEGETDNSLIRNHQDGKWKQITVRPIKRYSDACIDAVKSLGLDFGAVDFLTKDNISYILEVNTAPGLEVDNRLEAYANAFYSYLKMR